MAAITITTPTFLDGGTARVAGDTYTINGTTFTIRTDTRVHANAPASMTGSLSNMTVSTALGGSIVVDGTAVRWMAFTGGSGTVPAIGTTVSQGAVSGYLLGVWADYVSAPVAVGGTMPASGYMKFRSVTGGQFIAGTALTGITATAAATNGSGAGADAPGWIEIAMDTNTSFQSYELGNGVVFTGAWFYLDNTTGTRGQQISTPTNGGGTGTHCFGVQIETAPGSGVFEWYPTMSATLGAASWTAANYLTDIRNKFVETMGNGVIRIGSDGTNNIAYLPAAGCKVRMPNILGQNVTTAARATNQVPGAVTRAGMINGNYSIDCAHLPWTITGTNLVYLSLTNSIIEAPNITLTNNSRTIVFNNTCLGSFTIVSGPAITLGGISNLTSTGLKLVSQGYAIGAIYFNGAIQTSTFTNTELIVAKPRTAAVPGIYSANGMSGVTFNGIKFKGCAGATLTNCTNVTFTSVDYVDRLEGNTTATNPHNIFNLAGTTNFKVDGLSFGEGGVLAETQPYASLVIVGNPTVGTKLRNFGTRTAPLSAGSVAAMYPASLFSTNSADLNLSIQRIYITATRGAMLTNGIAFASTGILIEDVYGLNYFAAPAERGNASIFRKNGFGTPSQFTPPAQNVGTHWTDWFLSDTTGSIKWMAEPPSTSTAPLNTLSVTPSQGTGFVGSITALSLDTLNDAAYSECAWNFLGHTGFQNVTPTIAGAASGLVISYQLDTGSGYSGTWKTATGANLSAETISPAGFKMKIRIQQTGTGNTADALQWIIFPTTSTLTAQASNMYPLDTVALAFTGLQPGTEVKAYVGTNPATATLIGGVDSTVGSTFSFTHSSSGQTGFIAIFAIGYQPIYLPYTYASVDTSLLIQQTIDRNYVNP